MNHKDLIEKLAIRNTGSCGERFERPILIGDCLSKISDKLNIEWQIEKFNECVLLWQPLGFTKSLQEISEMVEKESTAGERIAKNNAYALLDFLCEIFNPKEL